MSALYYTAIKDRLYCESSDSVSRKAAQFILLQLFKTVIKSIAPVVPHLAEELYLYFNRKENESIFKEGFQVPNEWKNDKIAHFMENIILNFKTDINKRQMANTIDIHTKISVSEDLFNQIKVRI